MRTYTLHVPTGAEPGDAAALDRADLVRDGFSWGAFLFTALWFFVQRLWLAGLLVLILEVALAVGLRFSGTTPEAAVAAEFLLSFLIGLEANSLKRWTYGRRGRPVADVVLAGDREEAESLVFARWLARRRGPAELPGPRPASLSAAVAPLHGPEPVIGLFPEPEHRR